MELLQKLLTLLQQIVTVLSNPIIFIPVAIFIIYILVEIIKKYKEHKEYMDSAYYKITHLPFKLVKNNKGRYGEYLTYKYLKAFENEDAKFLFNIYIPKENGETTEIDVLMICSKGLFVFESKNYSGWIFGSESQKNWHQTLPTGRGRSNKEHFYNPVMQNRSHIKHLKTFLGEQIPMHSIITFSDRCTLKSVEIKSNDVSVINRYNVFNVVTEICNRISNELLTTEQINDIYNKLYQFTQIDSLTKEQHVSAIRNNLQPQTIASQSIVHESSVENIVQTNDNQQIEVTTEVSVVTNAEPAIESVQETPKCPRCNSALVLRTATRGANAGNQFYGCSNYPKCRYIKNLDDNKNEE